MQASIKNLCILVLCLQFNLAGAQVKETQSYLAVEGEVTKSLKLSAADLLKMQRKTVSAKSKDGKLNKYTGVSVQTILKLAGVTGNHELRGKNLSKYLLVKCADGYQVIFSLAELDSSFTNKVAILADRTDGKPLPYGKGPFRLIVPDEKKPARSCFQVTSFVIRFAAE